MMKIFKPHNLNTGWNRNTICYFPYAEIIVCLTFPGSPLRRYRRDIYFMIHYLAKIILNMYLFFEIFPSKVICRFYSTIILLLFFDVNHVVISWYILLLFLLD